MTRVSVSEFRQHLHVYVEMVSKGETVQLVRRGEVVAELALPRDWRADALVRLRKLRGKAVLGDVTSPINEAWEADGADP